MEIKRLREKRYEESKHLTSKERVEKIKAGSQTLFQEYDLKIKFVNPTIHQTKKDENQN